MPNIGSFSVRRADPESDPTTFEFEGETFTVSPKIGIVPLADFIEAARSGLDTAAEDGILAMRNLLVDVVVDSDQERLMRVAKRSRASGDDLMPIVRAVWRSLSERPTREPSDSPGGSSPTGGSSRESASSGESWRPAWMDSAVAQREMAADPHWADEMQTVTERGRELVESSN